MIFAPFHLGLHSRRTAGYRRAAAAMCSFFIFATAAWGEETPRGRQGEGPLAIRAAKALACGPDGGEVIDDALVLVRDGRIERVGLAQAVEVPAGYARIDLGELWLMPGMIDLHSHVGAESLGNINDTVLQCNPGLRVQSAVVPGNSHLLRPLAAGVTTVLFIPGSGSNVGGQGVLMKTVPGRYEDVLVRDPGSLKVAQGDNPKRWGYGMARALMNHHIRKVMQQGQAYAERWAAYERGEGDRPRRHLHLDVFRVLLDRGTQISTHTQYYQVILSSLRTLTMETDFDAYIDHGSFDSWKLAPLAESIGVPAALGPREVNWSRPPRFDNDGAAHGTAWGFQREGLSRIAFNTDAPVVPQEELPLQAAMGVRYGFDRDPLGAVRGLTIVPAQIAGIDGRVGSIAQGKDADLVAIGGDPVDPRSLVERVWIEGREVYDAREGRRW